MTQEPLPYRYTALLRMLNTRIQEAAELQAKLQYYLDEDGIDIEAFLGSKEVPFEDRTEALAYILNGEVQRNELEETFEMFRQTYWTHKNKEEN